MSRYFRCHDYRVRFYGTLSNVVALDRRKLLHVQRVSFCPMQGRERLGNPSLEPALCVAPCQPLHRTNTVNRPRYVYLHPPQDSAAIAIEEASKVHAAPVSLDKDHLAKASSVRPSAQPKRGNAHYDAATQQALAFQQCHTIQ